MSEPRNWKQDVDLEAEFTRGVNDYWSGKVPPEWDAPDALRNPYLAGWNLAADQETEQHWFMEEDEEDDDG